MSINTVRPDVIVFVRFCLQMTFIGLIKDAYRQNVDCCQQLGAKHAQDCKDASIKFYLNHRPFSGIKPKKERYDDLW